MSVTTDHSNRRSRKEQKSETRQSIKEAARRCLEAQGYQDTSIATIASEAGVAHGTFYVHFQGKEELLDELLKEFNEGLAQRLFPVFQGAVERPLAATVRGIAEIFLDYWKEHRSFVESYAHRSMAGLDVISLREGVNPPMLQLLRAALASRLAGGLNLDLVTHALLSMWLRIGLQFLFNENVTRDDALNALVRLSVAAVTTAEKPEEGHE